MTDRTNLLLLLNAARSAGRQDYVRHVAADWLAIWPGDREVTRLLANSELELGFTDLAAGRFAGLIEADPEVPQAYVALASIRAPRATLRGRSTWKPAPRRFKAWHRHQKLPLAGHSRSPRPFATSPSRTGCLRRLPPTRCWPPIRTFLYQHCRGAEGGLAAVGSCASSLTGSNRWSARCGRIVSPSGSSQPSTCLTRASRRLGSNTCTRRPPPIRRILSRRSWARRIRTTACGLRS